MTTTTTHHHGRVTGPSHAAIAVREFATMASHGAVLVWVAYRAVPLPDASGATFGVIAVAKQFNEPYPMACIVATGFASSHAAERAASEIALEVGSVTKRKLVHQGGRHNALRYATGR